MDSDVAPFVSLALFKTSLGEERECEKAGESRFRLREPGEVLRLRASTPPESDMIVAFTSPDQHALHVSFCMSDLRCGGVFAHRSEGKGGFGQVVEKNKHAGGTRSMNGRARRRETAPGRRVRSQDRIADVSDASTKPRPTLSPLNELFRGDAVEEELLQTSAIPRSR